MFVTILLFICALGLSGIAGYYSIIGMAAIFAGAFWPVVAMTGILEISKLVVSSWLYQKWEIISVVLKIPLTLSVIILMGITSLGIFGFLSKAHVDQNLDNIEVTLNIEQIESKIANIKSGTDRYESQLKQLDRAIDIQLDEKRGVLAGQERKKQEQERTLIRQKLDDELKNIQELQAKKVELKQKMSVIESKVGPIRYVAEFFADGKAVDLDQAVRWMIVIIVLVFDPLAVLMILAANIGFRQWAESKKKTKTINSVSQPTAMVRLSPEVLDTFTHRTPTNQDRCFVSEFSVPEPKNSINSDLTISTDIPHALLDGNQLLQQDIKPMEIVEEVSIEMTEAPVLNADEIITKLKAHTAVSSKKPKIALIGDDNT